MSQSPRAMMGKMAGGQKFPVLDRKAQCPQPCGLVRKEQAHPFIHHSCLQFPIQCLLSDSSGPGSTLGAGIIK
jgi:hypothetical protein